MAITPEMIRLADAFRIALLARERTAATLLVRRYGAIWQAMQTRILDLTEQAAKLRAAGKDVEAVLKDLSIMRQLQAQVRAELGKFVDFSADTIEAGQARAILAGERDAYQLTLAGFPRGAALGIRMQRMPAGAVNALVGYLADGSPLNKLLTEAMGEAADRMFDTMLASLARGDNPRVLARAMRDDFGMGLTRALRIARTEQLRAYRTASLHQYRESDVVVGWERRAAHDERTCMACIMLDGTVYSLDTPMADHPQGRCFPAGTLASGPLPVAASMRYYAGQLVRIRTASGIELSLTPNHPVLTLGGWVAAERLGEGDYVIRAARGQDAAATVNVDDYQIPTPIEQIAGAFPVVFGEVPAAAEDFHGDGIGSDVYVVRANRLLGDDGQTALCEPRCQQLFGSRLIGGAFLAGFGNIAAMLEGLLATAHSFLGDLDAAMVFLNRRLFGQQAVRFCQATAGNAGLAQTALDNISGDAESLSNGVLRFASDVAVGDFVNGQRQMGHSGDSDSSGLDGHTLGGGAKQSAGLESIRKALRASVESSGGILGTIARDVSLDRILEISRTSFRGHVYNLHTRTEWYIANSRPHSTEDASGSGLVVHNCVMLPHTKTWAEMGLSQREPDFQRTLGKDWFQQQPEAVQRQMMGALYEPWKAGKFQLSDIPGLRKDATWGDSWTPKSLKELLNASSAVS